MRRTPRIGFGLGCCLVSGALGGPQETTLPPVRVSSGATIATLSRSTYRPYLLKDEQVPVTTTVMRNVNFGGG